MSPATERSRALPTFPIVTTVESFGSERHRSKPTGAPGRGVSRSTIVLGLLGTVLLVVGGGLAGAVAPNASGRWWSVPTVPVQPRIDLVPALTLFYGGMIVLVRAWLKLRREVLANGAAVSTVVLVAIVWAVPLLVGPPLGSRDVYAYTAQGVMAVEGIDVYQEGPAALGDDPVLDPVDPLYLDAPVVYGPVFVALSSALTERTGGGVVASVLAFRAVAVLGLAVAMFAVRDLARAHGRNEADAFVLTLANPLVLLHLVSGAHNEAIMLAFLMSGVAIGRRARWRFVGIALCAFAASIKVPAALGAVFLAWPWIVAASTLRHRVLRLAASMALALGVITLATRFTGWGWGWVDAIMNSTPVDAYLSVTRVIGGGVHLATGLDAVAVLAAARFIGLAVAAAVTLTLLVRGRQSAPVALGWSLLLFAVLHPTTQPWYLTWGLLLLAATSAGERNRGYVALCASAAFVVLPVGPQLGLALLDGAQLLPVILAAAALALLTLSPLPHAPAQHRRGLLNDVVTVIVPTRNEAGNVGPMLEQIALATSAIRSDGRRVEVLYVDDSDDDTPSRVLDAARTVGGLDVRLHHRSLDERHGGLGGAVVEGFERARGTVAVVIDGDLQHPPSAIADLVAAIGPHTSDARSGAGPALAVASRRIPGGSDGVGLSPARRRASLACSGLARGLFPSTVGPIHDPLSGCFAVRLSELDLGKLHPDGFKILLEVLATHDRLSAVEVAYEFRGRAEGVSKASWRQGLRFLGHLVDLRLRTSRPWAGAAAVPRRSLVPARS